MQNECRQCIINKNIDRFPEGTPEDVIASYREAVLAYACEEGATAPGAAFKIKQLRKELFHEKDPDFTGIKRHFNELMLTYAGPVREKIEEAEDPLGLAVRYALTGNFIDFSALARVEEEKLAELLEKTQEIQLDGAVYERFRNEIRGAKQAVYVTDNCGEIVMDKLLIEEMLRLNPSLKITALVRGSTKGNDATMEDAEQVALTAVVPVIGNGSAIEGTLLSDISEEAASLLKEADFILAKGQANYETMNGCGLNVYYLFMCKCLLFTERFQVAQFSGILTSEKMGIPHFRT